MIDDVMSDDVMSSYIIAKFGMNPETTKIAPNSSLKSVSINGQSSLTLIIPGKILEMIFQKKFDNFDDFFA